MTLAFALFQFSIRLSIETAPSARRGDVRRDPASRLAEHHRRLQRINQVERERDLSVHRAWLGRYPMPITISGEGRHGGHGCL